MFKNRSYTKELLDGENIPEGDLFQNLKELDMINHLLGGYNISFNALKKVLNKTESFVLVDIGCGGGDTLKRIDKWSRAKNFKLDLIGVDLKLSCINYAKNNQTNNHIKFICDDYKNISKHLNRIDIIHACLFCHHLTNEEITELIKFAVERRSILIINDLQRNAVAHYAIKILTRVFSKSYLVKNDAPLSVLRGFKRSEWQEIIRKADCKNYVISYKWAFRYQVIIYAN